MKIVNATLSQSKSAGQKGYILIVSVMLLLIVTMMTIAMGRGFFAEEGMAGNMRETVRAFSAAESALRAAEAQVTISDQVSGIACNTGAIPFTVCNAPAKPNLLSQAPFTGALANQPPTLPTFTIYTGFTGTISTTGGVDTYYALPVYYLYFIGTKSGKQVYQITAVGYGGNQNAVAIVQSNFAVTNSAKCLESSCG